jgi:competence protein ComEC
VLAAVVAGLAIGPLSPVAAVAAGVVLAIVAGAPTRALVVVAAAVAGGLLAQSRLTDLDATTLGPRFGGELHTRAVLLEQPRPGRFAASALARLSGGAGRGERVVLRIGRWAKAPPVPTGAIVDARGRLQRLRPFDDYQHIRGAHAVLLVRRMSDTGERRGGVTGALDAVRTRAEAALERGIQPPQASLLRGMVLGQDERLATETRQEFRATGLSHILAASGQNVILLAALAMPLLGLLGVGLRARLAVVLLLIAAYVPLAGGGASIQRAGVMGAAGVIAMLAGRPASRWYALGLAAAVTLALNPRATGDVGWQLSFVAVVSILVLGTRLARRLERRGLPRIVAEAAALTIAATAGTTPIIALQFGQLSLVSVPANLLAAAAVAPVMWLGMLSAAIGQVWLGAAGALNAINALPLAFIGWVAHTGARLPHASIAVHLSPFVALGAYAALAAVVASRRARRPTVAAAVVAACAAGLWVAAGSNGSKAGTVAEPTVSFLDVGQGDATLAQDGTHAILVDAGPADGPVLARLDHAGVRRLDVLVVTHDQADHEGGAPAVLRRYPVGLVVDGAAGAPTPAHRAVVAAATRAGARLVAPDAGEEVKAGRLELDVLWPHAEPYADHAGQDPNQRAIVSRLTVGGVRVLLPADAESDVTAPLELSPVDILKVAHHGSADPGLGPLLARLRPQVAVIEVGRHNSYGHPTPQALAALRVVPRVFRTDRDGTVRLVVAPTGARIRVHA